MRRLNAIDAIGPAWDHTQALMYAPRRWKLMVKLGAVAFFAQMGGCNSSFNGPNRALGRIHHPLMAMSLLVVIGVVALAIFLVTFYVSSRLQFVLFEIVLRRDTWVAPIWRRYGAATWRWIGLKLLFFVAALVCMAPLLVPIVLYFVRIAHSGKSQSDLGISFGYLFLLFGLLFLVAIAIAGVYVVLESFGLPSMALEATPLGETVRRVWGLLKAEPWQVIGYVLMRFLLNFAGAIGCEIVLVIAGLVLAVPLGGGAFILWLTLKSASLAGHLVMVAGWVVLAIIFVVLIFIGAMILLGGLMVFLQAYALYFLGGRYRLVGEYLEPEPMFVAPPPIPDGFGT